MAGPSSHRVGFWTENTASSYLLALSPKCLFEEQRVKVETGNAWRPSDEGCRASGRPKEGGRGAVGGRATTLVRVPCRSHVLLPAVSIWCYNLIFFILPSLSLIFLPISWLSPPHASLRSSGWNRQRVEAIRWRASDIRSAEGRWVLTIRRFWLTPLSLGFLSLSDFPCSISF